VGEDLGEAIRSRPARPSWVSSLWSGMRCSARWAARRSTPRRSTTVGACRRGRIGRRSRPTSIRPRAARL